MLIIPEWIWKVSCLKFYPLNTVAATIICMYWELNRNFWKDLNFKLWLKALVRKKYNRIYVCMYACMYICIHVQKDDRSIIKSSLITYQKLISLKICSLQIENPEWVKYLSSESPDWWGRNSESTEGRHRIIPFRGWILYYIVSLFFSPGSHFHIYYFRFIFAYHEHKHLLI